MAYDASAGAVFIFDFLQLAAYGLKAEVDSFLERIGGLVGGYVVAQGCGRHDDGLLVHCGFGFYHAERNVDARY